MRRLMFAVATALGVVVGAACLATGPATAGADDNATVCAATKRTLEANAPGIAKDLQQAAQQAAQGNTSAADATVKTLGPKFGTLGSQLQQVGNSAADQKLKDAVTGLGSALSTAGQSLTSADSLQTLDQSQVKTKAQQVQDSCGFTSSPGAARSGLGLNS